MKETKARSGITQVYHLSLKPQMTCYHQDLERLLWKELAIISLLCPHFPRSLRI